MKRSKNTLINYGAQGCAGYLFTALGAILPELRVERDLSRVEVALYPATFAIGLIVIGLAGDRVARLLGRRALPVALGTLATGMTILALAVDRAPSSAGALLMGLGAAAIVYLAPANLRAEHRDQAAVPIGEANATSSTSSVIAPLVIGAALALGFGWRLGFAGPPVVAVSVLLIMLARTRAPAPHLDQQPPAAARAVGRMPRAFRTWWTDLVLAVAVEFCLIFWAGDYLHNQLGMATDTAVTLATGFVLGMAVARVLTGVATRLIPDPRSLLISMATLALIGFGLFWLALSAVVAVAGLVLAGLGVALLYPITLAQALATWPHQTARAAARCALASGVAISSATLALGALADTISLRTATLIVPALLLVFIGRRMLSRVRPTTRSDAAVEPGRPAPPGKRPEPRRPGHPGQRPDRKLPRPRGERANPDLTQSTRSPDPQIPIQTNRSTSANSAATPGAPVGPGGTIRSGDPASTPGDAVSRPE
ncbi:MFS transporter [Goodfellowiella coeruleoviolacea]|uniref:Fucose permease n=1 Tax=Goodfellowiella coeruleoviolacea TaxID=334858 RepID=A0AAE3KJN2_9PSEU|nr:MFS transporter [Goodfellowiella coeruleoviolacea]MCP2164498.1 Fucose permease [Goodfellowiella coeruleoviolacea]